MRPTRRAFLTGAGSLALFGGLQPAAAASGAVAIAGPAFGASWRALVPAGSAAGAMRTALQSIVASIDAAMSPFRADSEIGRFNQSDDTGWFAASAPTCTVLSEALRFAALTDGAFDPTVGGVVGQFGFGPIARRSRGDYTGIAVRGPAMRKAMPDLTLDLCGIAKGYALDCMADALARLGARSYLLEVGGEVTARGRHLNGRAWQVAIERPEPGAAFQHVVALAGEALATSGDRINSYVVGGRRYSHIIDPHRREPADPALASVSVLAPTGMEADAMATALFAMGREAGPDYAERNHLAALFLIRESKGIREVATGTFVQRILA